MGIFSFLKKSGEKTSEIRKISKQLGDLNPVTVEDIFKKGDEKKLALEKLFDLIEGNVDLKNIMIKHGATRENLKEIYWMFMSLGAGQWINGEFLPVSALAFQATLDYVLSNYDVMQDSYDNKTRVCFRLVQYFNNGEIRPINPRE